MSQELGDVSGVDVNNRTGLGDHMRGEAMAKAHRRFDLFFHADRSEKTCVEAVPSCGAVHHL